MTGKNGTAEHHAAAANHHGQAAHYHREASKHYLIGKDYAHAAYMALAAHGHALKATWHGIETQRHYEELVGAPPASPGSAFGNTVRVMGWTAPATASMCQDEVVETII